jgi:hypothetical protein
MNKLPHSRKNTIFPCKGLHVNGPLLVVFSTLPHPVFHFFESADSPPHQSPIRIKAFETKRGDESFHFSLLPLPPFGGPENQRFHARVQVIKISQIKWF